VCVRAVSFIDAIDDVRADVMCISAVVALRAWSQAAALQAVGAGHVGDGTKACRLADEAKVKIQAAHNAGELTRDQMDYAFTSVDVLVRRHNPLVCHSSYADARACATSLALSRSLSTATTALPQVDQLDDRHGRRCP
jgi:hypothetical protein